MVSGAAFATRCRIAAKRSFDAAKHHPAAAKSSPTAASTPTRRALASIAEHPDRQITLDVQVTDKSGVAVRGLQKQDFTLLDDKQPKNILSFHAVDNTSGSPTDPPVEIVLVVDAVNATFQTVNYERNELKKFLLQNGGKLLCRHR